MRLILAVNKGLTKSLLKELEEIEITEECEDIEVLEMILQYSDVDVVILDRYLDKTETGDIAKKVIRETRKIKKNIRFIVLLGQYDEKFISSMVNLGIFDIIVGDEIGTETIKKLLKNPRQEFEFKKYLKLEEAKKNHREKLVYHIPRETKLKTITIGVAGVSSGSGTTHTALGLAYFLREKGKKVCIVDISENNDIRKIDHNEKVFKGIDLYFSEIRSNKHFDEYINTLFPKVKSKNYDFIIFDYGLLKQMSEKGIMMRNKKYIEMFRMDLQIICLGGASWKWPDITYYRADDFANLEPDIKNWNLIVNQAIEEKEIKREVNTITVIDKLYFAKTYQVSDQNENIEDIFSNILDGYIERQESRKIFSFKNIFS